MRIQHNIPAMNAYRNYNTNVKSLQGNLQKLSSGYKINKAGDDAAGLAISEKMRAQITGLEVAQKNAKDGISLVQTAEGALTEVHTMLNRMYSLAEQSANGTYADDVDREQLQKEVVSLRDEINRIADASNFNGKKLLDGSLAGSGKSGASGVFEVGAATGFASADTDAKAFKSQANLKPGTAATLATTAKDGDKVQLDFTYTENGKESSESLTFTLSTNAAGNKVLVGNSGKEYAVANFGTNGVATTDLDTAVAAEIKLSGLADKFTITGDYNATGLTFESKTAGKDGPVLTGYSSTVFSGGKSVSSAANLGTNQTEAADAFTTATLKAYAGTGTASDYVFTVNGKKFALVQDQKDSSAFDKDVTVIFGADENKATENAAKVIAKATGVDVSYASTNQLKIASGGSSSSNSGGGLTLQIGDTSDDYNKMTVSVNDCHADAIGVGDIDIGTQDGAATAMTAIKDAINYVSDVRGTLGSLQNRLDHTINNLSVQQENIQDAESTIRDVDVANEMMAYTKNNILVQSAQAMLAQANQLPQGVLQLLG